jgi:hypothetical protein
MNLAAFSTDISLTSNQTHSIALEYPAQQEGQIIGRLPPEYGRAGQHICVHPTKVHGQPHQFHGVLAQCR